MTLEKHVSEKRRVVRKIDGAQAIIVVKTEEQGIIFLHKRELPYLDATYPEVAHIIALIHDCAYELRRAADGTWEPIWDSSGWDIGMSA